ncbi:hypothetical protein ACVWZR_003682 [Bradyrhizobium sp. i1.3.1]
MIFFIIAASSASDAPVGGPDGGARPFCASVSSPRNPVVRRMGPELLGAGFVFLQLAVLVLLLRADCACPREKGNRCKRQDGLKDGLMEFHHVTPLRQPSGLHVILFC